MSTKSHTIILTVNSYVSFVSVAVELRVVSVESWSCRGAWLTAPKKAGLLLVVLKEAGTKAATDAVESAKAARADAENLMVKKQNAEKKRKSES